MPSVLEGDELPAGALTYTARFDEPMDELALDASDVELVGVNSGAHAPTVFSYDPGTLTLTLGFADLADDAYMLTLFSGDGQFEDLVGRDLDGEADPVTTVPSGDGTAGGDFAVHFSASDEAPRPYPVPLEAKDPLGSLIYDPSVTGAIGTTDDTDTFTIDLDDGQTITVVVDPDATLQPTVELLDPDSVSISTATAAAAGQDVLQQTVATTAAGTYTVAASGAGGTLGAYTAQVILNAAVEMEEHDGPSNDDVLSAEDIDGSFTAIGSGAAERGAVLGVADDPNPDQYTATVLADGPLVYYQFEDTVGSTTATDSTPNSHDGTYAGGVLLGQPGALGLLGRSARFDGLDDFVDVPALGQYDAVTIELWAKLEGLSGSGFTALYAGNYWGAGTVHFHYLSDARLQLGFNGANPGNFTAVDSIDDQWRHLVVTLNNSDKTREFYVDGLLTDQDTFTGGGANPNLLNAAIASWFTGTRQRFFEGLIDEVAVYGSELSATQVSDHYQAALAASSSGQDWYAFGLTAGQSATVALTGLTSQNVALELYDGGANLLALAADADNVTGVIDNFVAPSADTYYARVTGAVTDYSLLVTRDADFDTEPNDDLPPDAQPIAPAEVVLGHLDIGGVPITTETEPNDDGVSGGSMGDLPFANDWSGSFVSIGGID